ncbi:DNA sulfur modification protein DndB [Kistimonas asteriae]|uniref:DNA sulfur modification protein DndB n=1 Tax=Kistimonas asteriae TaxID=517724 RepID=UPI001BADD620|nr:DNA sulfur modification protein DndB [Kistimonas asteriae]
MQKPTYIFRQNDTHYIVPAIQGIQGGKRMFCANLKHRHVAAMIPPVDQLAEAADRAQRKLNKTRAMGIARYVRDSEDSYVLPALTVSLLETGMREVTFQPIAEGEEFGELYIPINHKVLLNDGQHRHCAIGEILKTCEHAVHDNIVLTVYAGVSHACADQMFVDINLNAVKPSGSINTLYNHRDPWSSLAVAVSKKAKILGTRTEVEAGNCSVNSHKTFPLRGIVSFAKKLLPNDPRPESFDDNVAYLTEILDAIHDNTVVWREITKTDYWTDEKTATKADPSMIQLNRRMSLACSVLMLDAVGFYMREHMSQQFFKDKNMSQPERIHLAAATLSDINWDKDHPQWEGRAVRAGKLIKNKVSVLLTSNILIKHAGISMPMENESLESKFSEIYG